MRDHAGRWCALAVGMVALAACSSEPTDSVARDADVTVVDTAPVVPDAAANVPDAMVSVPDADPNAPDADPNAPDATPPPDASPPRPDARVFGQLNNWCSSQPANFSFFVTSMDALWKLSRSAAGDLSGGFGGNFGGLGGADEICRRIASATGHGTKTWRAFLSATDDGNGNRVNAIERIGSGPWYDANGRMVASGVAGLLAGDRPDGNAQSTSDLPDECGVPLSFLGDAHDVLTGSNRQGTLASTHPESTCNDWTSDDDDIGDPENKTKRVMCGHSFPRAGNQGGKHWLSDHPVPGCGRGALLVAGVPAEGECVGCNGGYGAIYCFAL